jgi:plasmid stabilization system protein ParE
VTRLVFSPSALQDIERLAEFLMESDPETASATTDVLTGGLNILKDHPLIGRPVELGYQELIISRGRTGYVALYQYEVERDAAIILAIRHQREGGFLNMP